MLKRAKGTQAHALTRQLHSNMINWLEKRYSIRVPHQPPQHCLTSRPGAICLPLQDVASRSRRSPVVSCLVSAGHLTGQVEHLFPASSCRCASLPCSSVSCSCACSSRRGVCEILQPQGSFKFTTTFPCCSSSAPPQSPSAGRQRDLRHCMRVRA